MIKPNLFIVGAAKAGTTSLHSYLSQHPSIYMSPIKEPHFFSKDIRCENFSDYYRKQSCYDIDAYLNNKLLPPKHSAYNFKTAEQYLELFREVKEEQYVGEASVGYLYSEVAAKEIFNFNKNAKIIIILRHPTERAFSHWKMDLRSDNVNRISFLHAVEEDYHREDKGWGRSHLYVELGMYYKQIKRYLNLFGKEQVLILRYEDLNANTPALMQEIYNFLGVEESKKINFSKHNVLLLPRFPYLNKIIRKLLINKLANYLFPMKTIVFFKNFLHHKKKLTMSKEERIYLNELFNKDISQLNKLVDFKFKKGLWN